MKMSFLKNLSNLELSGKILNDVLLGNMFENGCYLRRQKRFKIPKTERDPSGAKSRSKEGGRNRHGGHGGHSNGSGSDLLSSSGDHDIKKVKSSDLFSVAGATGGLPPLSGPGVAAAGGGSGEDTSAPGGGDGLTSAKIEKHEYKYNINDNKYGDPSDPGMEHLVLPAAPGLGKDPYHPGALGSEADKYGAASGDKYQTPDMSHLTGHGLDHLHSRYSLSEGLLSLRPPGPDSSYPASVTSNPFSIHRLLPGPGSPMHPSLSKSDLGYGDYSGLQPHSLHHEAMYYQPPVYQVGENPDNCAQTK